MEIKIGAKITEIMKAKDITQKQLSKATGIAQSNISNYQSDKRTPSLENFVKIAKALYCSTDVLIGMNE